MRTIPPPPKRGHLVARCADVSIESAEEKKADNIPPPEENKNCSN